MNEILAKLLRLKPPVKAALTAAVVGVFAALYYVLFYMDLSDQIASATRQQQDLQTEKGTYEARKREYLAYRDELHKLQEEQRELLKALPRKAEVPSFMSSIQEQAELSGLEVITLIVEPEVPQDLYIKIPVRMEVRGGYHSLAKFFKNISEIRRIVNIESLGFTAERSTDDTAPPKLRARFIAATFRYTQGGT
jgi:type IV pilus assembly protein PilO